MIKLSPAIKNYRSVAALVKEDTKTHWNGEFLWESQNRQQDGSVIHAITTFGQYLYGPSSSEAAATIATLTKTFCNEYDINQMDDGLGTPGVLIGRYPGDGYAGFIQFVQKFIQLKSKF